MSKKVMFVIVIIVALCFAVSQGFAQNATEQEKKPWWKKIFSYPVKVTEDAVNITSDAVKTTAKGLDKEAETVRKTVTGQPEKLKNVVGDPVNGTVDNVSNTTKRLVDMPGKAAQAVQE